MENSENNDQSQGMIKVSASIYNLKVRITPHAWHPATDLFETSNAYIIKVEIAGMDQDDISVSVEKNTVVVCGQRPMVNPEGAFHRLEIPYGDFSTTVDIPHDIVHEKIEAFYKNGILTIILPKAESVNVQIK